MEQEQIVAAVHAAHATGRVALTFTDQHGVERPTNVLMTLLRNLEATAAPVVPEGCTRSHPHENMNDECQRKTIQARERSAQYATCDEAAAGIELLRAQNEANRNDANRFCLRVAALEAENAELRNPTPEMIEAGAEYLYGHSREKAIEWAKEEKFDCDAYKAESTYRAMTAARATSSAPETSQPSSADQQMEYLVRDRTVR